MKDSTFFKNKIRLFQNVMVGKNCFYVVAIQPARKGQRRERRWGGGGGVGGEWAAVEIPKRRTPS